MEKRICTSICYLYFLLLLYLYLHYWPMYLCGFTLPLLLGSLAKSWLEKRTQDHNGTRQPFLFGILLLGHLIGGSNGFCKGIGYPVVDSEPREVSSKDSKDSY